MIILMWLTRPSTGLEFQQVVSERVESGQILGAACGDPVFEVLTRARCEDLGECADVPMEGGEFWALGEDRCELPAFLVAQMVGVAQRLFAGLGSSRGS
ncbi:hypothetical protein [Streptomyces niveus]